MSTVVLSLGANLGDREAALQSVLDAMPGSFHNIRCSRVYETPPWGITDQPAFLNAVVVADTSLSPAQVLEFAQQCEQAAHRTHDLRWGPRTLDVDVIAYDAVRQNDPRLTLPHPLAHERAFVLLPLLEVEPDFFFVDHGFARDLLNRLGADGITPAGELEAPSAP